MRFSTSAILAVLAAAVAVQATPSKTSNAQQLYLRSQELFERAEALYDLAERYSAAYEDILERDPPKPTATVYAKIVPLPRPLVQNLSRDKEKRRLPSRS